MPPFKYYIRLTNKEKGVLRQLVRSAKCEARLVDRARVLLWAHDGVTIAESATRLACGREKIIFWRRRFLEGRTTTVPLLDGCISFWGEFWHNRRIPIFGGSDATPQETYTR